MSASASTPISRVPTNVITWIPNDVADKFINVPVVNNQSVDGNRSFNMRIYNPILNNATPTNVVVGSGSNSVVTIVDDDAPRRLDAGDFCKTSQRGGDDGVVGEPDDRESAHGLEGDPVA